MWYEMLIQFSNGSSEHLSFVYVIGSSSLSDELPNLRRHVLGMIGSL